MAAIAEFIKEKQIKAEVLRVETPFPTFKHIIRYLGIQSSDFLITQLLQGENKKMVVCIYPGGKMLDFKKIEKLTGIKRLRYADREIISKTTGFAPDGLAPIGFENEINVIMDEASFEKEECFALGGNTMTFIKMNPKDMQEVNGAEIEKITQK